MNIIPTPSFDLTSSFCIFCVHTEKIRPENSHMYRKKNVLSHLLDVLSRGHSYRHFVISRFSSNAKHPLCLVMRILFRVWMTKRDKLMCKKGTLGCSFMTTKFNNFYRKNKANIFKNTKKEFVAVEPHPKAFGA